MKSGVCCFSGHDVQKGKGRILVLPNGSSFFLGSSRARRYFQRGTNPKKLDWTLASRTMHKKNVAKKASSIQAPKVVKSVRSYVGMSLEELKSKICTTKPEGAKSARFISNKEKVKALAGQKKTS